jgi:uncharacterized protein
MGMTHDTQELCGKLDAARGYNMNTASGKPVWPRDPRAEDIRIEDIAASLSRMCRFNGHIKAGAFVSHARGEYPHEEWVSFEIYSVAQHSAIVCDKVAEVAPDAKFLQLAALLHDAHEYILGDMIKPQKNLYPSRKQYECEWDLAIANRFGLWSGLFDHAAIKEADYRIFLTEKRDLLVDGTVDFGVANADPYPDRIVPVLPSVARKMFLDRFHRLYEGE